MICDFCRTIMKMIVWQEDKENHSYQCPVCGWIIHEKSGKRAKRNQEKRKGAA